MLSIQGEFQSLSWLEKYGSHGKVEQERLQMFHVGRTKAPSPPEVTKALNGDLITNAISLAGARIAHFEDSAGTVDVNEELSEEELLITNPCLYAYNLITKEWGKRSPYPSSLLLLTLPVAPISANNVEPIEWNDEPFANLVLGGNQKTLIKALVEIHYSTDMPTNQAHHTHFDDFVQGKGQGLVINLFGNPGVGKTLTAEAMSERG